MIRVPGKAAIALLQALSAAFAVSSRDGHAQDRPGDGTQSMAVLGAAIEEARRSRFHVRERVSGSADTRVAPGGHPAVLFLWRGAAHPWREATHPSAPGVTTMPRSGGGGVMRRESGPEADADDVSAALVFVAATIMAGVADMAAWYLAWEIENPNTGILIVPMVAVGGPALGARVAGGDFVAALTGSFLGAGLGVATALAVGESGIPHGVVWSLVALAHGGATALFAAADWWPE